MKILYSVQATGNGHISRAMELLPYFQQYGEVDIFLSGQNSTLELDAPVAYRSKGLSLFYTCHGGLDYKKLLGSINPIRLRKEIRELPVEKYDVVINDFEFITSRACKLKNKASINFGHQASFMSDRTPRPAKKSRAGEFVLKNYARASAYIGLHFQQYDDFILTPVIKENITQATPQNKGHITVYLPSYCDHVLERFLLPLKEIRFELFSAQKNQRSVKENITYIPVNKHMFNESLINCQGIITGAGFETPAEALHLGKKLMAIPIKGQYEQQCNAAALEQMGIDTMDQMDGNFNLRFYQWMNKPVVRAANPGFSTGEIISRVMTTAIAKSPADLYEPLDLLYPDLVIG